MNLSLSTCPPVCATHPGRFAGTNLRCSVGSHDHARSKIRKPITVDVAAKSGVRQPWLSLEILGLDERAFSFPGRALSSSLFDALSSLVSEHSSFDRWDVIAILGTIDRAFGSTTESTA